jgi:hypothetical protein
MENFGELALANFLSLVRAIGIFENLLRHFNPGLPTYAKSFPVPLCQSGNPFSGAIRGSRFKGSSRRFRNGLYRADPFAEVEQQNRQWTWAIANNWGSEDLQPMKRVSS